MKVATITWSSAKDDTKVKYSEEFLTADPLLQADILSDLNADIGPRYLEIVKKIFSERKRNDTNQ